MHTIAKIKASVSRVVTDVKAMSIYGGETAIQFMGCLSNQVSQIQI